MNNYDQLKVFFDEKVQLYSCQSFIPSDPVSIPHLFTKQQDIEIAGFFAAIFSWGNRTTIINKSRELLNLMDMSPYQFCLDPTPSALRSMKDFKHRTFNADDLYYFIHFFQQHYQQHDSLETAFLSGLNAEDATIENGLKSFREYFFSFAHLKRTEKHIASPVQQSACKRINMFLRWMVRKDAVDFGLWQAIKPSQLVCPLDLHVFRVAKKLGLITRPQPDWLAAAELTQHLRVLDAEDPVKYDFALFSLGIEENY
jgi:uncharacterized protein (TIGR02757 family)